MDLNKIKFIFYNKDNDFNIECNCIDALKCLSLGIDKIFQFYQYKDIVDIEINNNMACFIDCDLPLEELCLLGIDDFIKNTEKEN